MSKKEYFITVLILGALTTVSPFSIDMYLPGFPAISKDLNTSIAHVQLSLTAYLVGISVGQVFYGPLLDRYGRKLPLYIGLCIYIIASILCAATNSVDQLIVMRFFQAIGGCVGLVAAQALVRDIFPTDKTAQVFSLLTLVVAVSPMIAPTVGAYVTHAFGWNSVFYVLALICLAILAGVYFKLPKGKPADLSISLKPSSVVRNFYTVMKQPQFRIYMLVGGISSAGSFAYIAGSADVFMNIYSVSEKQYGWIFALLAFSLIGSTQLNHIFLKYVKSERIVHVALIYQTISGILLIAGAWLNWYNIWTLVAVMAVFLSGQGLTGPNATALALAPFVKHAGSAAALIGSCRMAAGGIASAGVSLFHNGSALPMVTGMLLCPAVGLFVLWIRRINKFYRARKNKGKAATITWD